MVFKLAKDILRGVNATVWGGSEAAGKVGTIVKTGLSGADVVIGTSHVLEDIACADYVCASLSAIGSISSTVGMVLGNIPSTKGLTVVTGSITLGCRTVRYYCRNYGTFWGCSIATSEGLLKGAKFVIDKK